MPGPSARSSGVAVRPLCYPARVKLYSFDGVDATLDLVPLAARRALDAAGLKVSLEVWRGLPLAARRAIAQAGSLPVIDAQNVAQALAEQPTTRIEPSSGPSAEHMPEDLRAA